MQKESEKVIERKLVDLVKQSGGMCIKLLSTHLTGLPDRMCLLPGSKITFVELKSTGEKPRPSQVYIHKKLRALGFRVEVIDTLEGVHNLVESIKYGDRNTN
jgi:hypothetical protein